MLCIMVVILIFESFDWSLKLTNNYFSEMWCGGFYFLFIWMYVEITNLYLPPQYPEEIKSLKYNREFAVRGLHYDIEHGLLMKLDQFQQIQQGSIYHGLTPVSQEEVLKTYGGRSLPLHYVEGHLRGVSYQGGVYPYCTF